MAKLAELVAGYAGLRPPLWVLAARAADRVRALGVKDVRAYLRALEAEGGARELAALAETLRVGETRFFRHKAHVSALRRVVVPELAALRAEAKRVRAWSAGCATGEEAYTLAILLAGGLGAGWTVEVVATDISDDALAHAERGRYPKQAVANVPEADRRRWFHAAGDGVEVAPELRAMVRFEQRNLLEPLQPRGLDVIFCRNVLIYFDGEARTRVLDRLIESLDPGGFLFLGYAETLRGHGDPLTAIRTSDGVVYQKSEKSQPSQQSQKTGEPPAPKPAVRVPKRPLRPAPPARHHAAPARPRELALSGSYEDPGKLSAELAPFLAAAEAGAGVRVDLDGAEYLGDEAARVLLRARSALAHAGARLELRARRPAIRRFCLRHGLGDLP
jgi:chemotaxis protein methyltransferase CheR